jgi:hypothetical protein
MKANAVSEYLKNKEFLKTAGVFLGWIVLLGAVFMFLIVPLNKKIRALKDKQAMMEAKSAQYSNFKEFGEKLKVEREHVTAVVRSVSSDQILTDKTDQGVFAAISRICAKADVKLDKISPGRTGKDWNINFKASYDKIAIFFSLLEQSFKIDTFRIVSGRDVAIHEVMMIVYPVTVPESAATPTVGKDLFDLYNDVDASLTKLESSLNTNGDGVARDPMLFAEIEERKEPEKKIVVPKVQTPSALPAPTFTFTVEDIFWDPETPLVAIDGKVCREGESFRDYQVVKIREKNVDIKWRSRVYTLEPGNNKEVK